MGSVYISDVKIKAENGKMEGKFLYLNDKKYLIIAGEPKGLYCVEA